MRISRYNKKLVDKKKNYRPSTYFRTHKRILQKTLFKIQEQKTAIEMKNFLSDVDNPKHCENQAKRSDEDSNEKGLYISSKYMENDESPGKAELTKEFYKTFWYKLKKSL